MRECNKIFGIGLNKTGTTSLHAACESIGLRSFHYTKELKERFHKNEESGLRLLSGLEEFKVFSDNPIPQYFKILDQQYPGSLFIYTHREMDSWILSRTKHVERNRQNPNYHGAWLEIETDKWAKEYETHLKSVKDYFKHRDSDILFIDITAGEGFEKLNPFFGLAVPKNLEFPKKNTAKVNNAPNVFRRIYRTLRKRLINLE